MKSKLKYGLFITLFTLLTFETLLRIKKVNISYTENMGVAYASPYGYRQNSWFRTWTPKQDFDLKNTDYNFHYKINSLGLREREFAFRDSGSKHIICLGDSYTEGMGAPYDSSYPRLFENYLNKAGLEAEVLNAGVSGSDPWAEYIFYRHKLLPYHAQYLLICVNSTDLYDYVTCGGLSRFHADGTMAYKPSPWFEPIYKYSYAFRFLMHNVLDYQEGNLLVRNRDYKTSTAPKAMTAMAEVIDSLHNLATGNNCKLLVLLQPQVEEIAYGSDINKYHAQQFGLLQKKLEAQGMSVINLWPGLGKKISEANFHQYTYAHDSHYNSAGYNILAQTLLEELQNKYPEFWDSTYIKPKSERK